MANVEQADSNAPVLSLEEPVAASVKQADSNTLVHSLEEPVVASEPSVVRHGG